MYGRAATDRQREIRDADGFDSTRRTDAPTGERNLRRCPRAKCPGEVPWRSALASNVWWAVPGAAAGLVRPPRPARTPEVCRAPRPRPPGRRGRRGRVLERSDVAERRIRTLQGAIGLRRARVPPYSMLIWRPLPSAEAANPLPSDVSGLPPHTYCILTLLSCASFASPHVAGMSAECVPSVFKHLQLTLALHCTRHAIRAHLVRADASRLPLR